MKKLISLVFLLVMGFIALGCCPTVPAYPDESWSTITARMQERSNNLEAYIKDWMAGTVPAQLPANILPSAHIDPNQLKNFYLCNPDTMDVNVQWSIRQAEYQVLDHTKVKGFHWDPHCTYILNCWLYAPWGSKIEMKGKFPKCRFFSAQITPPYDELTYYDNAFLGVGEIPIVDVDIDPDPGHVNPFRIGSQRNATNRSYTVNFTMAKGNTATLNANCVPPKWRAGGNHRYGSCINYGGPWNDGAKQTYIKPSRGSLGSIWIRNYIPDTNAGFASGVGFPKLRFLLPDGRPYYIDCDKSGYLRAITTENVKPAKVTSPADSSQVSLANAWTKQFGIFLAVSCSFYDYCGKDWEKIRQMNLGVTGMHENQPAPGCWENAASCGTHINYLLKHTGMSLGATKVVTVTGTLPTFPATRAGQNFTAAQMRYWAITAYDGQDGDMNQAGNAINSVSDDELVLNANREYVICYSRSNEKPTNATAAAGVTWVNWGPTSNLGFTLRWTSVDPDWTFAQAPHEMNLTWKKTCIAGSQFDPNVLTNMKHDGFLGKYKPIFKAFKKATFESFGTPVTIAKVEAKANDGGSCGTSLVDGKTGGYMVLLPLALIVLANAIWLMRRKRS